MRYLLPRALLILGLVTLALIVVVPKFERGVRTAPFSVSGNQDFLAGNSQSSKDLQSDGVVAGRASSLAVSNTLQSRVGEGKLSAQVRKDFETTEKSFPVLHGFGAGHISKLRNAKARQNLAYVKQVTSLNKEQEREVLELFSKSFDLQIDREIAQEDQVSKKDYSDDNELAELRILLGDEVFEAYRKVVAEIRVGEVEKSLEKRVVKLAEQLRLTKDQITPLKQAMSRLEEQKLVRQKNYTAKIAHQKSVEEFEVSLAEFLTTEQFSNYKNSSSSARLKPGLNPFMR